ncbi:MAG: sulfonate transport system permease protein [Actinomycetota bacterium]|jgi:NitT/TauT family transport system permease protein
MAVRGNVASTAERLEAEVAGLDALELFADGEPGRLARALSALWPKLAAVSLFFFVWQALVWAGWKPEYVLPSPPTVLKNFFTEAKTSAFYDSIARTLQRAALGYGLAVLIGSVIGAVVSRVSVLRRAVGSMITGLQTMPSIAWFPLAILLFTLNEKAIMFVVILGAAPSIANGLISGIDHVPPLLLRSGKMLGAGRLGLYRHVILPASLPTYVHGLKQGWAFAWRSLLAGELLVIVAGHPSIGTKLQFAREFNDAPSLYSWMIVIFILGVIADSLFGQADAAIRRRWGLLDTAG